MSNQIKLAVEKREHQGKGASGRLRREGRVPAIAYGYQIDPMPVSVAALDLYHALHTEAGRNVLLQLDLDGETHLAVARDVQSHPVRGDYVHVDLLVVDKDAPISVEVPVHLVDDEDTAKDDGVINQILYTVPVLVRPLDVPNSLELSVAGMAIGDVKRVADLGDVLPAGASFDIEEERTVVTINAPVSEAELEALEESAGIETEESEDAEAEAAGADDASSDDAEEPSED